MRLSAFALIFICATVHAVSNLDVDADFRPKEWASLRVERAEETLMSKAYRFVRQLMGFPLSNGYFVYRGYADRKCNPREQIFEAGLHTGICFKVMNHSSIVGSYRIQVNQLKRDTLQVHRLRWMTGNCGGIMTSDEIIQNGTTLCGKGRGVIQGVGEIHSGVYDFHHSTPVIMNVVPSARIKVDYDSMYRAEMSPLVQPPDNNGGGSNGNGGNGGGDEGNPMQHMLGYRVQAVPSLIACHRHRNPLGGSPISYRTFCNVPRRSHNMRGDEPNVGMIMNVWYGDDKCTESQMFRMSNFTDAYPSHHPLPEEVYGGAHVFTPRAMAYAVGGGGPPATSTTTGGAGGMISPMPQAYRVACVMNDMGYDDDNNSTDDGMGNNSSSAPSYTPYGPYQLCVGGSECACVGPQCACSGSGCMCTGRECGTTGNTGCPAAFSPIGQDIPNCNNGTAGMMELGVGSTCTGPRCSTAGSDATNYYGEAVLGAVCYGEGCTCSGPVCFSAGPDTACSLSECKSPLLSFDHLGACRGVGCTCVAPLALPTPTTPYPAQGCACAGAGCVCVTADCACQGPDCANTTQMGI